MFTKRKEQKPLEYRRINFLNAFKEIGFEFLDEPSLLVEKVLSVDPNWIGHANYEAYGEGRYNTDSYTQSTATKVPCLDGEWVVVCYSKDRKTIIGGETHFGMDWHKYYICQVDFKEENLFRIVTAFEHIYDAFQYLHDNNLVESRETDKRFNKQISVYQANIALEVLTDFENEEETFNYDELLRFFSKHSSKSKEVDKFLKERNYDMSKCCTDKEIEFMEEMIYRIVRRFLPDKPFYNEVFEPKKELTIKEYINVVKQYKYNYIWNI